MFRFINCDSFYFYLAYFSWWRRLAEKKKKECKPLARDLEEAERYSMVNQSNQDGFFKLLNANNVTARMKRSAG